MSRARRRAPLPTVLTTLALLAGVGYRLWLLRYDVPPTNSDEATMGLAALHIAQGRHLPIWFYGQSYMGTLEAYLAAPLISVAGPSLLALRLPTLALYALFLALSWRLTRRLGGDPWYALVVVGFLALGSDRVVKNQLIAGGGYPELAPAGVALALLTVGLCVGGSGARPLRWAAWGLIAGLMLWVDPLLLPYLLGTGAVLVARRRRDLAGPAGVILPVALLLGAAPMLLDSLRHGHNPLAAVLTASGADAAASWGDRVYGGLVLGPPLGMGFCSPSHCAAWQLWWSLVFPILLLLAALSAWRTLRTPTPDRAPAPPHPAPRSSAIAPADLGELPFAPNGNSPRSQHAGGDERRVSAAVRLALLAGAAAVLAAYTVSSAAGQTPVESARYLSCLAVATPALLWPLWQAARRALPRGDRRPVTAARGDRRPVTAARSGATTVGSARPGGVAAVAVLSATFGTAAVATGATIRTAPAVHAEAERHRALVHTLDGLGVRHVHGAYWTCNRLTFATREQVVCAVVDDALRPGFDRLPAYRHAVAADPDAAWIARDGSRLATRLDRRLGPGPGDFDVVAVAGWRIYLPRT
ncbi:DUF423 domain-containing protein [Micromonospora sp. NPDC006766]|uniref:DUF423 domain-containing protein n=1 Tax=Micromonospora sp. NPDC006766 TaxID=3154778 RepID=UPI0033EDE680